MERKNIKILKYIPIINIFVFIYLIIDIFSKNKIDSKKLLSYIAATFVVIIIITIPRIIVNKVFNNETVNLIIFYIYIWIYFLVFNIIFLDFENSIKNKAD